MSVQTIIVPYCVTNICTWTIAKHYFELENSHFIHCKWYVDFLLQIAPESESRVLENITEIEKHFFPLFDFFFSLFQHIQMSSANEKKTNYNFVKSHKILSIIKLSQWHSHWSVIKAISKPKPNPFAFISNSLWLCSVSISRHISFFLSATKTNFYRWDFFSNCSRFQVDIV